MRRRQPDLRPEIEVLGTERGTSAAELVRAGPRGPRRPHRSALVASLAVVGLLLVGLALGDDDAATSGTADKEERDNRDRAGLEGTPTTAAPTTATTGSTATTVTTGPALGAPIDGTLLVFNPDGPRWVTVDLVTGAQREVRLPADDPFGMVAVEGGVVAVSGTARGLQASYFPLGAGADDRARTLLARGDQVMPSTVPDRVWVVDHGLSHEGVRGHGPVTARLVELDGTVVRTIELDSETWVAAVSDAGVVSEAGGRVFMTDERGSRPILVGELLGAGVGLLVVRTCSDEVECQLSLVEVATGRRRPWPGPTPPDGVTLSVGADGTVALTSFDPSGLPTLHLLTATGDELGRLDLPGSGSEPRWLPDDLGLLFVEEGRLTRVEWNDDELVATPILALRDLSAEVVHVVEG